MFWSDEGFGGGTAMKVIYQLFVCGIPKAQPRHRTATNGHVYNPNSANAWKEEIRLSFRSCKRPTITGAVRLTVSFHLPKPKSMKEEERNIPHTKKPDTDNLLKALMDALTEEKIWADDAQVYDTHAGKYYAARKTGARVIIEADF